MVPVLRDPSGLIDTDRVLAGLNEVRAMKPARDDGRLSPEERAELHRKLEQWAFGRRRPQRPMLVCEDGVVVGDAYVNVSPFDPNWRAGEEIKIRK